MPKLDRDSGHRGNGAPPPTITDPVDPADDPTLLDLGLPQVLPERSSNGQGVAPEDAAAAPVLDLMSEALSSPDEFGGAGISSPTAFTVRKPGKDEWFRVHPSFRPDFFLYERKAGNRTVVYLVRKPFVPLFGKAAKPCTIRLCVNVQGNPFLWACKHSLDGFGQSWADSRSTVAQEAISRWIAIEGGDGCYVIVPPERPDIFPQPKWPEGTANDWLNKGFAGLVVDRADHEAVLLRRGAAL